MLTIADLNMQQLQDLSGSDTELYLQHSENRLRRINEPAPGLFIAESIRVIARALSGGYEPVSLLLSSEHLQDDRLSDPETQAVLEGCKNTKILTAPEDILSQIAGYKLTGGALCLMQRKKLPAPSDILKGSERAVILEGINNPTNVGAIFRSAAALGADAILLTSDCSDPLYRRAARVSMGSVFQIPWTYFPDKNPGVERKQTNMTLLKEAGFQTIAMALSETALPLNSLSLSGEKKTAILLGNENEGLVSDTLGGCDHIAYIPMRRGVDSLNVAAASAVAFWELFK